MDVSINKVERGRQEQVLRIPIWSELHLDLLPDIFKRLSFSSLNQAKLVCSSWYSASRGCVPNQNQIPWLISFPHRSSRCLLYVPEDKEKVYRSRDLGVDFAQSDCRAICGNWLLLLNDVYVLYILNPLTGKRIDLPDTLSFKSWELRYRNANFWIDNKTEDYLVVLMGSKKFTKKGYSNWQNLPFERREHVFCNNKNQTLFLYYSQEAIFQIWDFSGDEPREDMIISLPCFYFNQHDFRCFFDNEIDDRKLDWYSNSRMVVTVSGDILMVSYMVRRTTHFCIYKMNASHDKWVQIDSLGDEALIYEMGITVVANGSIPGIKRNSIYFGSGYDSTFLNVFVYDLTTRQKEPLPRCVSLSIPFLSKSRWFFPS